MHFDFVTANYIESLLLRFFGITDIQHRDIYLGEWRAIEFRNGRYYHVSVNGGPGIERELNIIDFYDNGNGTFSAGIEIEIREFNEGELTDQRQHFNTAIIRPFGDTWQLLYWQNDANRNAPLPGYQPSSLAPVTAAPTQAPVLVNGQNVAFQAYHIDGSNFFRLRDIAYVLNGTSAQFNVEWDAANSAILLQTRTPYTPVGGEMAGAAAGSVAATPTQAAVYLDGEPINLRAYHIDGNNFFMLRDLGEALGFDVDWDSQARAVLINTD
ncbi:MAG: copper amine oxidase N-terminal domain-containing protein [Oscillospiraceae bacterium]|nr:copper amine oxidase N-terminal domain-containing protein [Oscillospiraceae bacterium]